MFTLGSGLFAHPRARCDNVLDKTLDLVPPWLTLQEVKAKECLYQRLLYKMNMKGLLCHKCKSISKGDVVNVHGLGG